MGNKHTGKIILFLILMYISSAGELLEAYYRAGQETGAAYWAAFINLLIVSVVMMAVPFLCKVIKGKKLPYKGGKALCVWNSILLFILPIILFGQGLVGGIGAIFFYFINKWTFVKASCSDNNADNPYWEDEPNRIAESKSFGYQDKDCSNTSPTSGWQCSCGRVHPKYESSCICGKSKRAFISQPQSTETIDLATTDKISFCRKCGNKLIDGATFCSKCGTKIMKE